MVVYAGDKNLSSLPFPAIVGQDELKRVLLAVAVNDDLDGALIVGEKGTAKSTAVRALVDLLPEQRIVADCPYACSPTDPTLQCSDCRSRLDPPIETRPVPLVTLPLGATRDRVVGTLSVEDALAGEADFDPGLLARAHRGLLYVDEVNLLDDHLVDVILDAAADGFNRVERDGISVSHPANFTLIGTMNPEEGDLRPQLRDRFALQATVEGCSNIDDRVEIIDRALSIEIDQSASVPKTKETDPIEKVNPGDTARDFTEFNGNDTGLVDTISKERSDRTDSDEFDALKRKIQDARTRVPTVTLSVSHKTEIASLCLDAGIDGHRGDIAIARTAITLAALDGRERVSNADLYEAATYALPHRLKSTPFEDSPAIDDVLDDHFDETPEGGTTDSNTDRQGDDEGKSAEERGKGEGTGNRTEGDTSGDEAESDTSSRNDTDRSDETENNSATANRGGTDPDSESPHTNSSHEADQSGHAGDNLDQSTEASPTPSPSTNVDSERTDQENDTDPSSADDDTPESTPDDDGERAEPATPIAPGHRVDVGDGIAPSIDTPDQLATTSTNSHSQTDGSRSNATPSTDNRGARIRTEPASKGDSIDAAASVRAAGARGSSTIESQDLRQSVRSGESSVTIIFAVDASASMRPAMREAKGVVLDLLRESYEHRDEVAFVAFAGDEAAVLLPPTTSVTLAARHLKDLPTGDRTPLPAGLEQTRTVLSRVTSDAAVVVIVTDGRANVTDDTTSPTAATRRSARALSSTDVDTQVLVVDAGDDTRAGLSQLIAEETNGERISLTSLTPELVHSTASRVRNADD